MFWFYSLMASIPAMFFSSLYLLRKWAPVRRLTAFNLLALVLYTYLVLFSPWHFFEQDPLGLKKIFLFLYILFVHALGCFTFAVYHHYKSKNGSR